MEIYDTNILADKSGVHPRRIREYLRDGQLTGFRVGREWRFTEEDLQQFIDSHRPARKVETTP